MQKIIRFIIIIFSIMFILLPITANAKTLGDLKNEYNALEEQYNAKNNEIQQNIEQSEATSARIDSIYGEIAVAESEIKNLNEEINRLNEEIKEKSKQVNELMKFLQVSEGESTYLEYIFKAKSITDFIYRVTVTKQLSSYNNKLINDMNDMIVKNNENIASLNKQEEDLKVLQADLKVKLVELANEKETLDAEEESIEKDIEYSKAIIDYYIDSGCDETDDIATCANDQLPPGTQFWRPLESGIMFSTWWSDYINPGYSTACRYHAGVDIANGYGTNVYPIANGRVVYVGNSYDGYGNKIIIHHNVNGRNYSSLYGHLQSIYVSVDDIVTPNQVIGAVGSTGNSEGPHLHLNVCVGLTSCVLRSDTVDPGAYINFPADKNWFYDKTTYYSGYYSNPCGW